MLQVFAQYFIVVEGDVPIPYMYIHSKLRILSTYLPIILKLHMNMVSRQVSPVYTL